MTPVNTPAGAACGRLLHLARCQVVTLLFALSMLMVQALPNAQAAPKPTNLNIVPVIQSIKLVNGQLVASGFATAIIKGKTFTAPFTAPVNIALAADQSGAAAAGCPILDLTIGPINLNLLGLVVQTSPICLTITAYQGGGLLGDLLCAVAHLLDGGLSLNQILSGLGLVDPVTGIVILPGLTTTQLSSLNLGLVNLLNGALQQLLNAVLGAIDLIHSGHTCSILHLALGPIDLTLLGLNVHLDNCNNGPVTVDIKAVTGPGNLLGNLLCELLGGGLLNLGLTLGQILDLLAGLLSV
jgi:hypothetical protein